MRAALLLLLLAPWLNVSSSQSACETLPAVPHAYISKESNKSNYSQGNTIYFTCEVGYVSALKTSYVCSTTGWVKVRTGKCYLKPCELPSDTPNGYFQLTNGEDFVFGATIEYTCDSGYQMVSKDVTRTCMLDGWTNHVPICEVVSCTTPDMDAELTVRGLPDNDSPILYKRALTFSCDTKGKYLKGSRTLTCDEDGKWDNEVPTCEDFTCNAEEKTPKLIINGLPQIGKTMKYGHALRFDCEDRATLNGVTSVTCKEDGNWDAPFPTCVGTSGCENPPAPDHGDLKDSLKPSYKNNEKVEFVCPSYYIFLDGQSHRTCVDGKWVGELTCLKPCTVDEEHMKRNNIKFKFGSKKKLYAKDGEPITFACGRGNQREVSGTAMKQLCKDGHMTLPRCE